MRVTTVGIDLAKNIFQIHGVDEHGKIVVRKQLKREQMCAFCQFTDVSDRHGGMR